MITGISAQTIKIGKLEVASTDLVIPNLKIDPRYTYEDHVEYYLEDHPEWRLPTVDELLVLYQNKAKLGMEGSFYMAYGISPNSKLNSKYANQECWVDFFSSGKYDINFNQRCYVRLIKK